MPFYIIGQTGGSKETTTTLPAPPKDLEVKHLDVDSSDDEEELSYPAEAKDVFQLDKVKSIWDELQEMTPLEASQKWPSKATRKNTVKKEPRYDYRYNTLLVKYLTK